MALKATIYKATLALADMDRGVYADHALTIARHPSETDERMMVRVLAFALNVPADTDRGALDLAKSLWDTDEPDLWQRDLTGTIVHGIDVGQPDDKRLMKASGRAERVSAYSYASSTPVWWGNLASKITRARNLVVWQIPAAQSQALASLVQRTMHLQISVQDGSAYVGDGTGDAIEVTPVRLTPES
jgi:uncharacterized protein YaeQ